MLNRTEGWAGVVRSESLEAVLDVFCATATQMVFLPTIVLENGAVQCDTMDVRKGEGVSPIIFRDRQREVRMSRETSCVGMVVG